jgi:hypothetical protein
MPYLFGGPPSYRESRGKAWSSRALSTLSSLSSVSGTQALIPLLSNRQYLHPPPAPASNSEMVRCCQTAVLGRLTARSSQTKQSTGSYVPNGWSDLSFTCAAAADSKGITKPTSLPYLTNLEEPMCSESTSRSDLGVDGGTDSSACELPLAIATGVSQLLNPSLRSLIEISPHVWTTS